MSLGENIKKYRKASRLSQEQVGKVLGLDRSSVSKIERGETPNVKPDHISALCSLFGCTPTDLIGVSSVKVSSSAPLTPEQKRLIALIPLLDEAQVNALLELLRVLPDASL